MAQQSTLTNIEPKTIQEVGGLFDQTPLTDAVVQLTGQDGNAFGILARVCLAIRESNCPELEKAFLDDATAGDYDHLLITCMRYVEVL
jgi:hypothetical protein